MKDKTFADYLMRHGVEFPADTVVIDIESMNTHRKLYQPGHEKRFMAKGKPSIPIFDVVFCEIPSEKIGLLFTKTHLLDDRGDIDDVEGEVIFCTYLYVHDGSGTIVFPNPSSFSAFCIFAIETGIYIGTKLIPEQYNVKEYAKSVSSVIGVALSSMAAIHQKAPIDLITHPRGVRRRIKRETGKEPSPYFMLKIEPGKTQKRYIPSGRKSGVKMSQHIVRGHFRHVIDHPLPQFNGTFWIPSHMRGDKSKGETLKGYTIVLPDNEAS